MNFERDSENRIVCDENPGCWLVEAMQQPSSFAYFGEDDEDRERMFVTWALGPVIEHRDSGLVDRSNAEALRRFLASDPSLEGEYRFTRCNHWAVGWVEHVSFHAYGAAGGEPTRVARIIAEWFRYLREEYPIADDDLHSEMECEETSEWMAQEGPYQAGRLGFLLPEDWQDKVTSWWDANRSSALESVDDGGASPDDDDWGAAFAGCGFAREN
jgi:hypothetical protein